MISPPPAPLASPSTHFFFVHASLFRLPCPSPPLSSLRPPPSFSLSLSLRFQRAPIHPSFLPAWHGPLVHVPWPFLPPPLSLLSSSPVARFALPFPSTTPCSSARLKRLFFSPFPVLFPRHTRHTSMPWEQRRRAPIIFFCIGRTEGRIRRVGAVYGRELSVRRQTRTL